MFLCLLVVVIVLVFILIIILTLNSYSKCGCYWSWNYLGCWHQTCPPIDTRKGFYILLIPIYNNNDHSSYNHSYNTNTSYTTTTTTTTNDNDNSTLRRLVGASPLAHGRATSRRQGYSERRVLAISSVLFGYTEEIYVVYC